MFKIALAAGAISMAVAADCNGVYLGGGYTAIATDVCMNINAYGQEMSHMASCDDDGDSATYTVYNGSDCDDADYWNSTDVMDAGLNATYVICDATDCDYAMVTEYESMGNWSWGNWSWGSSSTTSSPYNMTTTMSGASTTSGDTTTTTPFPTTTTTPSPTTTTTSGDTTTTTSSGTTWSGMNMTWDSWNMTTSGSSTTMSGSSTTSSGCDFDYSEEVAFVIMDCLDFYGNDTLWFQWKCKTDDTDSLTMQYYVGGNCTGGTLAHEQAYTNDSCAEVMCVNVTATDTDSSSSDDTDTDSSSEDVDENTSGAASLEHLVAALFAVIALVAN